MNRSAFFQQIAAGTIGVSVFNQPVMAGFLAQEDLSDLIYIGSYTDSPEDGITICRFSPSNGSLQPVDVCHGVDNPSFLIFSHTRKYIYAVNETANFGGKSSGAVSAFKRDEKSGLLTFLNSQPSLGAHPCHLTLDRTGRFVLVANYTGGNVAVLQVLPGGHLGEPVDRVQHSGRGPDAARQEAPHAHSVTVSPDNRFVFVCDLGIDKIMIYQFNDKTGKLTAADLPFFQAEPGAGPRHFAFSKDGKMAFVVNELNSTLDYLAYDIEKGILTGIGSLSTLPVDFSGANSCADVHVHPNGRFVYASNRGHNSLAVFLIDSGERKLKLIQNQSTLGKTPRNFAIHPSGEFLLAANQDSESLQVFSIDPRSGRLAPTGKSVPVNKPVCILL